MPSEDGGRGGRRGPCRLYCVLRVSFEVNGQAVRLAPGLRIRGQDNMLAMTGPLIGARLLVHYTTDVQGLVNNVWILTPGEAEKKPWPTTAQEARAWTFDPAAQAWSKP